MLVIPTNAVSMTFAYTVQGNWQSDSLAVALNGTNVFLLPGNEIETNVTFSSGAIDVSAFAGQTNEFFVGIVGGTSSNAQMTLLNIQFFGLSAPPLQAKASGANAMLSWPLAAQDFALQYTTNLATTNIWTTVTNVPAVLDFQNVITNPIIGGEKFFRLKKN